MDAYFKVRLLQLGRVLRKLGAIRVVFLAGLSIFLCLLCYEAFTNFKLLPLFTIGIIVSLIHFSRRDLLFIRTSLRNAYSILLVEYYTLLLPLLIITIFTTNVFVSLACIFYIAIVSHISIYKRSGRQNKKVAYYYSKYIPQYLYEWLSGFRKNPIIFIIYLVGVGCSFLPYVSCICIWIIIAAIGSFYGENEPLLLVLKDEVNAYRFTNTKIYHHTLCYITFICPIVAASLLFNSEQYILTLYVLVASAIALIAIIATKYATYLPGSRSVEFQIVSGVIVLSVALFPFMVFTLITLVVNYSRAINNLNTYLHAYD